MSKQKIMKWALLALLLSSLTFELMPGSVTYYADNTIMSPETAWNFFTVPTESAAASYLVVAGTVTALAAILALVAVCFRKPNLYRAVGWSSLIASALAAAPYLVKPEGKILQPNVIVLILLLVCWFLAMSLDKSKDEKKKVQAPTNRL